MHRRFYFFFSVANSTFDKAESYSESTYYVLCKDGLISESFHSSKPNQYPELSNLTLKAAGEGLIHWSRECLPFLTGSYCGHKIS